MYDVENVSTSVVCEAIKQGASDIHLVPTDHRWLIQFRINGKLTNHQEIPPILGERLLGHLKYNSGMNIGEKRLPQSYSMNVIIDKKEYALRLSTLPTRNKESLAIRILPQTVNHQLMSLPVLLSSQRHLMQLLSFTHGLCLISGPTGSGKTTTLYAILNEILSKESKKIITIEDPIEQSIDSFIQIETNQKAGITFEVGLKAALRHDPDIMMVGEIRDANTAKLAVRAALTGHLVFATVHASNNYASILRLLDFGVSENDVKEALKAVICQCLVRKKKAEDTREQRSALYTFEYNQQIKQMIECTTIREVNDLKHQARKAWALGIIEENELERLWVG
ncbi:competence type IV pilus ATPase ComGA [Bacillus sp. FJAT-45037]|uniref:competence type IV pilus ATPase ComGA n=1 Tax=Bacillus sp. FJAT-45037 TaxID=2011007 RepID=UPI0012FE125E|nr:competence type IV pilus ATPase ComGA [Bacillus sp. FJAT-45037]